MLNERVEALRDLREYVADNKTNLRVYLGIKDDEQQEDDHDSEGIVSEDYDSEGSSV